MLSKGKLSSDALCPSTSERRRPGVAMTPGLGGALANRLWWPDLSTSRGDGVLGPEALPPAPYSALVRPTLGGRRAVDPSASRVRPMTSSRGAAICPSLSPEKGLVGSDLSMGGPSPRGTSYPATCTTWRGRCATSGFIRGSRLLAPLNGGLLGSSLLLGLNSRRSTGSAAPPAWRRCDQGGRATVAGAVRVFRRASLAIFKHVFPADARRRLLAEDARPGWPDSPGPGPRLLNLGIANRLPCILACPAWGAPFHRGVLDHIAGLVKSGRSGSRAPGRGRISLNDAPNWRGGPPLGDGGPAVGEAPSGKDSAEGPSHPERDGDPTQPAAAAPTRRTRPGFVRDGTGFRFWCPRYGCREVFGRAHRPVIPAGTKARDELNVFCGACGTHFHVGAGICLGCECKVRKCRCGDGGVAGDAQQSGPSPSGVLETPDPGEQDWGKYRQPGNCSGVDGPDEPRVVETATAEGDPCLRRAVSRGREPGAVAHGRSPCGDDGCNLPKTPRGLGDPPQ